VETARPIEHPVADVLRVLAVSRSSGALEIRGIRGGTFFLSEGDVTYAHAVGVPPTEVFDGDDPQLPSTIRSSIIEVGLTLLAEENADGERPLFRPGRRHWSGRLCRLQVETLLSEISQRLANFTELGVGPDDQVQLCGLAPGRIAVLNRRQWAMAAGMSGPQTPRSLARRSGTSLSVTIETVSALVAAGVVQRDSISVQEAVVQKPAVQRTAVEKPAVRKSGVQKPAVQKPAARQSPARATGYRLPEIQPPEVWSPEARPPDVRLPQRVRSQTPRPTEMSNQGPDELADGRALALRLLEGLRRL
jgi:hypothetical protein